MAGLGDSFIDRLIRIESGGNPQSVTGSYRGLGQFGRDQERRYGITDDNWTDPTVQRQALQAHTGNLFSGLTRSLGREPTEGEVYLAHQQGIAGAPALLSGGSTPAWQAIRRFYPSDRMAQLAVTGNIPRTHALYGRPADEITSQDFANLWTSRFPGAGAQPAQSAPPAPPAQTVQPGGQRMAGLLDWLIPQAEAGTPGSFAPANRREQFGPPRWLYSPPMESIAPPSVNPRTGAPIPSMLPPGRSRALGGGGAAPAAAAAAPLGVPGPMMPGGGIGSDFAASPPPPPQVPPFDEGTTSLDPETTMRLAQAEHGRQNPPAPTPRRPGFGEAMESWMSSPLFQAAVALATQRDPAAAMASAGTAGAVQSEYERQQSQRTVMDRIWGEAFPNGQPNMQHPLVRGLDPRVAQMIASMGPEQALPMLAQSAMKPGSFDIQDGFLVNKQTGQVIALQGGGKPPSGFQWAPGGQQLEPIPGGPGEHIAADQAGKLAVMRTAQNHFQSARSYFLGSQFGPGAAIGHAVGGAVLSPQYDQAARTVKLAVEGALRAVSGAAAPEAEVKRLTDFFTPRAFDPPEVRRQKMDMLQEFMRNHEEAVTRGRRAAGSNPAQPQSPAANDPLGIR